MTLVLTRSDVAGLIDMAEVVDVVEAAHRSLSLGDAVQPARASFDLPGHASLFVPMVAGIGSAGVAGVKLMTDTPANRAAGRPVQQSAVLVADPDTGAPEALVDGGLVTRYRTAAASAVATRHLAREQGACLGLLGTGGLARTHLEAIRLVRPVGRVVAWSRTAATAAAFADHARLQGVEVEVLDSPQAVVAQADVLCTLTPSREPLLEGAWLRPGMHVNAVGAPPRDDHRELDDEAVRRSRVVVDRFDVAREESGDVMIPYRNGVIGLDHFDVELGDVITGRRPGRTDPEQITLYNSVGLPVQDMAVVRVLVDKARAKGLGHDIDLGG